MIFDAKVRRRLTSRISTFAITSTTALSILLTYLTSSFAMTLPANSIELIHGDGVPTHAIIWLHGLGATANDFPPIVPELGLSASRAIRFIFPQAPDRPITINGGMRMPGWYDIKGVSIEDKQDAVGMAESREMLDQIIQSQIESGIASENIILAGFSQGGAVTYFTGVRSKHKLAGLLTLSTYLPFDQDTKAEQSGNNIDTPIFASHGTHDGVVPLSMGKRSVDILNGLGYSVTWKTYPMEHQVVMPQIKQIGAWINEVFSKQ
jgi:phospholipase/carboxylesterase